MTEEIVNLPNRQIQILLRSEFRHEVEAAMMRHIERVAEGGGLLNFIGPLKTKSNTWTAYARGPAYLWPVVRECSDEQGRFEVENAPEE